MPQSSPGSSGSSLSGMSPPSMSSSSIDMLVRASRRGTWKLDPKRSYLQRDCQSLAEQLKPLNQRHTGCKGTWLTRRIDEAVLRLQGLLCCGDR